MKQLVSKNESPLLWRIMIGAIIGAVIFGFGLGCLVSYYLF